MLLLIWAQQYKFLVQHSLLTINAVNIEWPTQFSIQVKAKAMLLTDSGQSVCSGVKRPWANFYYFQTVAGLLTVAPSLTRGRNCSLQLLLDLASSVTFGSEPHRIDGHVLLFYSLFELRRFHPLNVNTNVGIIWIESVIWKIERGCHWTYYSFETLKFNIENKKSSGDLCSRLEVSFFLKIL